jgi:PIN domain nuclease of toxin-antitoxin system
LAIAHWDPLDRMIMAQAKLEKILVITYDKAF